MRALLQLISFEYRKYVFTRGFLLFFLIFPISLGFGFVASLVNERAAPVRHFVVIDETGGEYGQAIDDALAWDQASRALVAWDEFISSLAVIGAEVPDLEPPFAPAPRSAERLRAFSEAGGLDAGMAALGGVVPSGTSFPNLDRARFVRVTPPVEAQAAEGTEGELTALLPYLKGDAFLDNGATLFAAVVIPDTVAEGAEVEFWTDNLVAGELRGFVDSAVTGHLRAELFAENGVDRSVVDRITAITVPTVLFKADRDGEGEAAGLGDFAETFAPLFLAYVVFALITSVGGMLLTSTVEEKSTKIVEVLLSSVSATQLMVGKLIGLALVGLTIPAIFLTGGFFAIQVFGGEFAEAVNRAVFTSPLIPVFLFYFVIAYLLFASIYLAVGAMSSTIQDAQSFVVPLTILLILPAPFLQMVIQDPNGIMARIMTWVPLYTPFAIMMRINAEPPMWEILGATALLLVVVIVVLSTMGRIYRNGVLNAGGAPTWRQARELARHRQ